jgi:hypothetical protein
MRVQHFNSIIVDSGSFQLCCFDFSVVLYRSMMMKYVAGTRF